MIPSDVRLFTWLDVEEVLERAISQAAPSWWVKAAAYWNGLTVTVKNHNGENARQWLREVFDPRIENTNQADTLNILLEAVNGDKQVLPVLFEEVADVPEARPLPLTFHRPSAVEQYRALARPIQPLGSPPIAAFHSFKGGVGRTTHAISLAIAASERQSVLLVDGDVEAPGISWLVRNQLPNPPVAFADLIALAHGDTSPGHQKTIDLVVDRLRNAPIMAVGSPPTSWCFVLPSFRNLRRLPYLEIRPEHLVVGQDNPFVLTELIRAIGRNLGVDLIIADLRAGYSELAAGLLLDPRVYRIFVTTLSGQSMEGTIELMSVLGERAPSVQEYEPYPAVIVNQIPEGLRHEDWKREFDRLVDVRARFLPPGADPSDDPLILESSFEQGLQMTAADWENSIRIIRRSSTLSEPTRALLEWLPFDRVQQSPNLDAHSLGPLNARRRTLAKSAHDRIFAERGVGDDFLDTGPLRALAEKNISQLPIAVIVGAKGAGKTFSFLQQVRARTWRRFVEAVIKRAPEIDAPMSPVLFSVNLGEDALRLVTDAGPRVSHDLRLEDPVRVSVIRDVVLGRITTQPSEAEWRELWLDCIAWAIGYRPHVTGAGRQLAGYLDHTGNRLIALFDGLEDLFQDIATNAPQQLALRVLLQDVPLWLAQRPTRNLAILVYVRRDLVSLAVRQNYAQLLDRYGPYRLQWDRVEALRLTDWLSTGSVVASSERSDLEEELLKERLFPLWGRKLGSDESREARSADWVLNALSDYKDQIQARDLVRFISVAAEKSISDTKWEDRLLTPPAIRDSLPECSREKIDEIKRENEALRKIFEKIENVPQTDRLLPFTASFASLDAEDLRVLEENGAVYNDGGSYYLPEIYLHGLGFTYSKPGRRRVLSNRRK